MLLRVRGAEAVSVSHGCVPGHQPLPVGTEDGHGAGEPNRDLITRSRVGRRRRLHDDRQLGSLVVDADVPKHLGAEVLDRADPDRQGSCDDTAAAESRGTVNVIIL